tara:strand:+ start:58771 stop:59010 length:240 start_codon:yes stop_codon:yes gene_type:complete
LAGLTGVPDSLSNGASDPAASKVAVVALVADPAFAARNLFGRSVTDTLGNCLPALPLPLDFALRDDRQKVDCPGLEKSG